MTELVVDTSAMVAILTEESGAQWLAVQLNDAAERSIAAPNVLQLGIVLEARTPDAVDMARRVLREARITIEPCDEELVERAMDAWRRFGKGRHRAALTFGDCFTYALAERTGRPILCTGTVFSQTDLPVRTPPAT